MSIYGKLGVINTNLMANAAYQGMEATNQVLSMHQNRLATLKKLNGSGDDPAGFVMVSKMKIEMDGMDVCADNIANAQNMINIANNGATAIKDLLTEMRKKVLEACDGSKSDEQLAAIQSQISQYQSEIKDTVSQTTWNGTKLLDWTITPTTGNEKNVFNFQTGPYGSTENVTTLTIGTNLTDGTHFDTLTGTGTGATPPEIQISEINLVDATSPTTPQDALAVIDDVLSQVDGELGNMGAMSKRLDIKSNLLQGRKTQVGAAVSRVEDADMISEQLTVAKLQVQLQANLSLMSQAQQAPNLVLQLMGMGQ